MSLQMLKPDLKMAADPERAKHSQRFFKTGKGEYGYGDVFLGIKVPDLHKIARKYKDLSFEDIEKLLHSKYHEERLIALLILVYNFEHGDEKLQKKIFDLYLANTKYINNWDLVDLSAPKIVGGWLYKKSIKSIKGASLLRRSGYEGRVGIKGKINEKKHKSNKASDTSDTSKKDTQEIAEVDTLRRMALSKSLWERRIGVLATFYFISKGKSELALEIAEILINDKHDLIHKAVGWMLREIGKRCSLETEETFLKKHYKTMPRTMLRYSIEQFPEEKRKKYLQGAI